MDYPTLYSICGIMDPYQTVTIYDRDGLCYQGSSHDVVRGQAIDSEGYTIQDCIVYELEVRRSDVLLRVE